MVTSDLYPSNFLKNVAAIGGLPIAAGWGART